MNVLYFALQARADAGSWLWTAFLEEGFDSKQLFWSSEGIGSHFFSPSFK